MKSKSKKLMITSLLILGLLTPTIANAYSGSYSFDISHSLEGSKKHSLAKKSTSTTAKANTYDNNGSIQSTKSNYRVGIYKNLLTNYSVSIPADGYSYKKSFGVVNSGSYTVNITKSTNTGYGSRVKGSGTIDQ